MLRNILFCPIAIAGDRLLQNRFQPGSFIVNCSKNDLARYPVDTILDIFQPAEKCLRTPFSQNSSSGTPGGVFCISNPIIFFNEHFVGSVQDCCISHMVAPVQDCCMSILVLFQEKQKTVFLTQPLFYRRSTGYEYIMVIPMFCGSCMQIITLYTCIDL